MGVADSYGRNPPKDSVDDIIAAAESLIISTTPGTVPPHMDDGGHLPFGGSLNGTRGPSLFGKRKIVTSDADPNPQALLLNYPPAPTAENIRCWEKNYKSHMYEDPSAEAVRFTSTNFQSFGPPDKPSCLAAQHQSYGNLRRTAFTRPTPSPAFYPPERPGVVVPDERSVYTWEWPERKPRPPPPRDATAEQIAKSDFVWKWPERAERQPPPQIKRPEKVTQSFLEEYELRPPWHKY